MDLESINRVLVVTLLCLQLLTCFVLNAQHEKLRSRVETLEVRSETCIDEDRE